MTFHELNSVSCQVFKHVRRTQCIDVFFLCDESLFLEGLHEEVCLIFSSQ